ncbi:isoprenoid biosynthesis glyoxalase ElbB [Gayadomonas joobiniege]|uniref:isoprenoid biosynthesis glyoxalase ElbB n=1 Tax=Gayadomonas joobiniege TaxID=1234606 RepID=UPI000379C95F|nr:isoprenoid biosynthesis glyoxalase ElbB [Gayadomonas joobiniege]
MSQKKFALILSGCGVYDGAEINEVVLTRLALEENQIQYQCFAPDCEQAEVVNHLTGKVEKGERNQLVEAARICRGDVLPLSDLSVNEFNALIVPGGFGVAKNLSDFAYAGEDYRIQSDVLTILKAFKDADKPVGYMCIAPVLLPLVYGDGIKLTLGEDSDAANIATRRGGEHVSCKVDQIVIDKTHKAVSTPAYMLAENLLEAQAGINKLVKAVIDLVKV